THTICSCKLSFYYITATEFTNNYTLSLHDALPIFAERHQQLRLANMGCHRSSCLMVAVTSKKIIIAAISENVPPSGLRSGRKRRSEEHTSELQSRENLVCRLLLEKKKNICLLTCAA